LRNRAAKLAEALGRPGTEKLGDAYVPYHVASRADLEQAFCGNRRSRAARQGNLSLAFEASFARPSPADAPVG
jgi:hypothetical protein